MVNKPDIIKERLVKKGFVLDTKLIKGHDVYALYDPDTGGSVRTCFSRGGHGKSTLGTSLLHTMSRQLKFDNYEDFQDFISCNISEEEYRSGLKDRGVFDRKPRDRRGSSKR